MADEFVHVFRLGQGAKTEDRLQESTGQHTDGENLLNMIISSNRHLLLELTKAPSCSPVFRNAIQVTKSLQ
jgi:hypothetical protein